jgi:hypothetical protein
LGNLGNDAILLEQHLLGPGKILAHKGMRFHCKASLNFKKGYLKIHQYLRLERTFSQVMTNAPEGKQEFLRKNLFLRNSHAPLSCIQNNMRNDQ